MSYTCRFIHARSNERLEPPVNVACNEELKLEGLVTKHRQYDLLLRSRGNDFYGNDAVIPVQDGDVVTAWYVDHTEGVGQDTYLSVYAFDRTAGNFLWPTAFVTQNGNHQPGCPFVVRTTETPQTVDVDDTLPELSETRRVHHSSSHSVFVGQEDKTLDFEDLAIVTSAEPSTQHDRVLVNVQGNCLAIANYEEHRRRSGRDITTTKFPKIQKHDWPKKRIDIQEARRY